LAANREPAQPDQRIQPHVARALMSSWQTKHACNVTLRRSGAKYVAKSNILALDARMREIQCPKLHQE
jgi:hypothetical protein